jgi:formylglycine-generating enzyme required for sulfatase activity
MRREMTLALAALALMPMTGSSSGGAGTGAIEAPVVVTIPPHLFLYRPPGDFTRGGAAVNATLRTFRPRALAIMTREVTAAEYRRCVRDHGCAHLPMRAGGPDRPAVGVSWLDATAYATWLSRRLGTTYRLPTDEEWAFAAGSRYRDGAIPEGGDPGTAALRRYQWEIERDDGIDGAPRAVGSFGVNENGVADMAGNVWEWTSTCFVHEIFGATGARSLIRNCGVRVVEGRHRTFMVDFVRDPRAGGCSVGKPPDNLGFRLVRDGGS